MCCCALTTKFTFWCLTYILFLLFHSVCMCVCVVAHANFVVRSKLCFQYRVPAFSSFCRRSLTSRVTLAQMPNLFVQREQACKRFFRFFFNFLVDSNLIERWVCPPGLSVALPAAAHFTKCSIKKEIVNNNVAFPSLSCHDFFLTKLVSQNTHLMESTRKVEAG